MRFLNFNQLTRFIQNLIENSNFNIFIFFMLFVIYRYVNNLKKGDLYIHILMAYKLFSEPEVDYIT